MLSGPRALASASEASDYMLHEYLVRNDKAHRTANRWHGGGAEALGLPERVSRRRFMEVLEGHVPGTDIRLGRVVDGEHQHRPGWDCTFSAPKSVSLEALLHDNKAVMRAHDASVRAALDWMEAEFLQTRGYDPATGRRPRVKADGLVAATFRHVASRNNDPQLHTHAVIANMTRNAAGEWRSVEPTLLQRNRRLIGAWYRNDLARRLGEMGYVLVPTQVGGLPSFELAGYSPAMLETFSTRRRDILDYMADKGWKYDAKTAQAATLHTRKRKDEPAPGELAAMWKARAEALGLARDADEVRLDRTERGFARPPARFTALEAVWQAVDHLEERHAVFGESDLLAAALGREPGRHTHVDLRTEIGRLREDGHLVAAGDGALTTRRTLRAEKEVSRVRSSISTASSRPARAPGMARRWRAASPSAPSLARPASRSATPSSRQASCSASSSMGSPCAEAAQPSSGQRRQWSRTRSTRPRTSRSRARCPSCSASMVPVIPIQRAMDHEARQVHAALRSRPADPFPLRIGRHHGTLAPPAGILLHGRHPSENACVNYDTLDPFRESKL